MSWRDRLELAFFRDVPFSVKRADTQIGRRTAVHEYAQRDDAWPEDMGRLTRRFSIEAFIVGENYDRLRDDLIEALETAGPGELVHPYYGRKNVALASPVRISESAVDEGGIARFSFEFIEAGDNTQPGARIDTREEIDAAAGDARQAAANDFKLSFVVGGKAGFVEGSALAAVQSIVTALNGVRNGMIPDLTVLTDYVSAAKALAGSAAGILRAPVDLANSILGLVAGVRGLAPYWFEIDATAYLGSGGQTSLRLDAEYELLLTQQLILQPAAELNLYGKSDTARGIGSGLSDVKVGMRLRYEFSRQFAPYVGVEWAGKYGGSKEFMRAAGEKSSGTRWVAGVCFWLSN